jgi:hypothetical protein
MVIFETGKKAAQTEPRRLRELGFRRDVSGEVVGVIGVDEVLDEAVAFCVGIRRQIEGHLGGGAHLRDVVGHVRILLGQPVEQLGVEVDHLRVAVDDAVVDEFQRRLQPGTVAVKLRIAAVMAADQQRSLGCGFRL